VNDSVSTPFNTPVTISVLVNDTDPNLPNDSLHVTNVGQGAGGTAVVNANGTITYTPGATFSGVDSFVYGIADAAGLADSATVTVTVGAPPPVNRSPVAVNDNADHELQHRGDDRGAGQRQRSGRRRRPPRQRRDQRRERHGGGECRGHGGGLHAGANFSGLASFSYGITDGRGGSATASVT
jgi:hypothetical protein